MPRKTEADIPSAFHGLRIKKCGQTLQFKELTAPVSADSPCGNPDITSEPAYQELQIAIEGKPGSQMGDAVIPDQPPNFQQALALATEMLGQSKHLALLVGFTRAAAGKQGFAGFADALKLVETVASDYWDSLHPVADEDDPDDPWWERISLLRELTDSPAASETLYRVNLVEVRHIGAFSSRDIDIAAGRLSGSEEDKERCNSNLIRGAFTEAPVESLQVISQGIDDSLLNLESLGNFFNEKLGAGNAPSFSDLIDRVNTCKQLFAEFAGDIVSAVDEQPEEESSEPVESGTAEAVATTPGRSNATKSGGFAGRDDVAIALDSVMRFYQKHEPSSPVPILLARAREMVYKNFFDLLRELAPQHKDSFRDMMRALNEDPLAFLIEDSYNSFLNGESYTVPEIEVQDDSSGNSSGEATESGSAESAVVQEGTDDENSSDDSSNESAEADTGEVQTDAVAAEEKPATTTDSTPPAPAPATAREVNTREEVLATLTQVQAFFERNEPSSPVPLIVQKVRNLVPKNFLDLLAEFDKASEPESE